ncbi:MAG: hypothetical protein Q8P18_31635 [Pseudomonadota bacterium]|nr:hypothetical protein [Pseudomonadota bacterium]
MNPEDEIPADVRGFLRACIRSVGHMEALVLLMEGPNQVWTESSVAGRLYVPEASARSFLRDLAAAGLLDGSGAPERWLFAPSDAALVDQASRAVLLYRQRLLPMTRLIRARDDAAAQLADAFRIRKD